MIKPLMNHFTGPESIQYSAAIVITGAIKGTSSEKLSEESR